MLTTKQESILYGTHQAWKYNVSLAINGLGIVIAVGAFYYYNSHPYWHWLGLILAVMLLITGFIIALSIKCPNCGSRWYWQALKAPLGSNGNGLEKLRSQKSCPTCKMGVEEIKGTDLFND